MNSDTPIADMVRVMLERDASRDDIVTAIEAAERHAANVTRHANRHGGATTERSKAAERAKRYRDKKRRDGRRDASRDEKPIYTSKTLFNLDSEREEKKESVTASRVTPNVTQSDWPKDFELQFWQQCPRRVGKSAAMKALDKVRRSGVSWAIFHAGVLRWNAEAAKTESKFVKHPTTWLHAGCWDDEPMKDNGVRHEDSRSISAAAAKLAEGGGFRLPPKPRDVLLEGGSRDVRLLPSNGQFRS